MSKKNCTNCGGNGTLGRTAYVCDDCRGTGVIDDSQDRIVVALERIASALEHPQTTVDHRALPNLFTGCDLCGSALGDTGRKFLARHDRWASVCGKCIEHINSYALTQVAEATNA